MTNADKFKEIFGIYATELWARPEKEFLEWLNADVPDKNVGDIISRRLAIDEMEEYWRSLNLRRRRIPLAAEAVYMDLKGVVATLPSAEPKWWIPVTERLPEDGEDVLITFCGEEETRIVPVNYCQKIWFDCIFDIELNPHMVTAWIPLPAPWKGGAEDEQ